MKQIYAGLLTVSLFSGCSLIFLASEERYEESGELRCSDDVDNDGDERSDCADDECTAACLCGDGVVDAGEQCDNRQQCDDGADCDQHGDCAAGLCLPRDNDGCSARCTTEDIFASCGNGVVDVGEVCDTDSPATSDGCSSGCLSQCGNGAVESAEQCDDANLVSGDGCDVNCHIEISPDCGNNILEPQEECDDGNTSNGDGCDSNCTNTDCGNGVTTIGEECDDGNNIETDGCTSDCTIAAVSICGNGSLEQGEECDDANNIEGDGCTSECIAEICGDGIINGGFAIIVVASGESCDDGRRCDDNTDCTASGVCSVGECLTRGDDGCSPDCVLETIIETEPNEDGSPTPNSTSPGGNDFDAVAITNATNNGALQNGLITATFSPVGDEDVFAVENISGQTQRLSVQTLTTFTPRACAGGLDTFLSIRSSANTAPAQNDDKLNGCAGISDFIIEPGDVVFVHVVEKGDDQLVDSYLIELVTQ